MTPVVHDLSSRKVILVIDVQPVFVGLPHFQSLVRSLAPRTSFMKGDLNLWLSSRSMNCQE